MINALYSSASGMQAYSQAMNVTASNIANVNSNDYTAKTAVLAEKQPAGVEVAAIMDTQTAPHVRTYYTNPESYIAERMNNIALGSEKLNETTSLRAYQANANAARTADEMIGNIVNMKA